MIANTNSTAQGTTFRSFNQRCPPKSTTRHHRCARLHIHTLSRNISCNSIDPDTSQPEIDIPPSTEWDPEGILKAVPTTGGHFARRNAQEPTSPPQTLPQTPPPQLHSSDLLAPRKRSPIAPLGTADPLAAAAAVQTIPRKFAEVPAAPDEGLGGKIEAAFQETFWGISRADRVLDSFRRLRAGEEFVQLWPGQGIQKAESYVAGLSAMAFPDLHSGQYSWLEEIEKNASIIQEEFFDAMKDGGKSLAARGNKIWVAAARKEAVSYGPNWRTLVLQDRGVWEETNSRLFPKTKKILVDLKAPTLEVFFAKQDGKTGIASHTDNANFIQTSHLGIDVPEGECFIKVGEHTRGWENGKIIICDTSFMHETENNSEKDRYVLILRHWHPEMTPLERVATLFLFQALDDPSASGIKAAQKNAMKELKGLATEKVSVLNKKKKNGGGAGFGKKN